MKSLVLAPKDVSVALYRPQPGMKAITIRRAMVNMPEVMGALNSIERAVFIATTDKPFSEYEDSAIFGAMSESLKWIAKDVGIRDTDSKEWKMAMVRISQIVKRYYENFTMKDVKMAFEMTVTGELNEYFAKDRNGNPDKEHYQMFNADYFCKIMNAYRACRKAVLVKASAMIPKPEREHNPAEDVRYLNNARRRAIQVFLHYKYRGVLPKLDAVEEILCYNNLSNVGLAEPISVTIEEQREVVSNLFASSMGGGKQTQFTAYKIARRKAIEDTFKWMVEEEIQITDYIKLVEQNQENIYG